MSYSELMNYSNRQLQQRMTSHNDEDEVQRMLSDFEQYFSMDKEARQRKLEYLENRQKRIDESLASIERKHKLEHDIQEQDSIKANKNKKVQISTNFSSQAGEGDAADNNNNNSFLHNKVVQLARALAKVTRERDRMDLELAKTKLDLAGEKEKNYVLLLEDQRQKNNNNKVKSSILSPSAATSTSEDNSNNNPYVALEIEKDIWRREIVALRNALEQHVASDRKDRHIAQQDKEVVLNEVAEELGQVMAQRDLAYVELEKLKRLQDFRKKELLLISSSASSSPSPSPAAAPSSSSVSPSRWLTQLPIEIETAEKQIGALQLQLAHARRDVTVQSVNLHVANEKYSSLKEDVEKVCSAFQTTTDQCNGVLSILSSAHQQLREKPYNPGKTSYAKLTSSQISELMLFISRVRSDFSNISSLLQELRSDSSSTEE